MSDDWSSFKAPVFNPAEWPTEPRKIAAVPWEDLQEKRAEPQPVIERKPVELVIPEKGEPVGIYISYSQGYTRSVLAGPYDSKEEAVSRIDFVWDKFTEDAVYRTVWEVKIRNKEKILLIEIPLSEKRKGAYGKI